MLTALNDKKLISNTLINGANDYVTKPFDVDELLARISVQLRNNQRETSGRSALKYKEIELDLLSFKLKSGELTLDVSKKEAQMLKLLIENPNKIYTKEVIYEFVWEETYYGDENTINVHVSNLRKKLAKLDSQNRYIETVWGIGIKLSE